MSPLLGTLASSTLVADRRDRFERAASDRRLVVGAVAAALATARERFRPGRDPAHVLVALPAAATVSRSDDRTDASWSPERVA